MNKETVKKIIEDLITDKKKLHSKIIKKNGTIFVDYGYVKFFCEFKRNEVKFTISVIAKNGTFTENDFNFLDNIPQPAIQTIPGFNTWRVVVTDTPKDEYELKNTLKQLIDNYS
jgi:hypothetical protein|nr:MAG TPA: hypothetical protein [Caudoviricetes sp.]